MIHLETDRLLLRNYTLDDVNAVHAYFSHPEVARYEDFDPMSEEEVTEELSEWQSMDNRMAVILKSTGALIGSAGYWEEDGDISIDYDFNPDFWGQGYATEAAREVLRYLREDRCVRRVYGDCDERNTASAALLERLGFRLIGKDPEGSYKDDAEGNPIRITVNLYELDFEPAQRITLRPFTDDDLPLFERWLRTPHVAEWFEHPESWLYECTHRDDEFRFISHFIAQCDGVDFAFCQFYDYAAGGEDWPGGLVTPHTFSIDYCIGEAAYLNCHLAPRLVHALEARILAQTDAQRIIVEPLPGNAPSRFTLLSAGYLHDEQYDYFYKELPTMDEYTFTTVRQSPALKDAAAAWFHEKWSVPEEAYAECMEACIRGESNYDWYLCLYEGEIVGGMGVIDNDFHERTDLTPNVCAVYTEEPHRCRGIAGKLLHMTVEDCRRRGISPVYLLTDHDSFYERYGWEFFCMVSCDGGEQSRLYIHR